MEQSNITSNLLDFIQQSPSCFHVIRNLSDALKAEGFIELKECEKWAKEKGCTEFASDCELDNDDSFRFHRAMEFEEANRIICFKKDI